MSGKKSAGETNNSNAESRVILAQVSGVTAELRQSSGGGICLPPHFHEEYQVILNEHRIIEYAHRGTFQSGPLETLFVVEPGEVHATKVVANTALGKPVRALNIPAPRLASVARDVDRVNRLPHFSSSILTDRRLFEKLLMLHESLFDAEPLVQDCLLIECLGGLLANSTETRFRPLAEAPNRIRSVREYLVERYAEPLRLQDLSTVAGLSPFHLLRLFRRTFGLPPHAYQVQIRLQKAKSMLHSGRPLTDVAISTGFSDHAHFTRIFRRFVGVPPSRYLTRRTKHILN